MPFYFDPLQLLMMAPAMLIALWATIKVKRTFAKYSRVRARSGLTGAEAARALLRANGISDVSVVQGSGFLSDLYDPIHRVIKLSPGVYASPSLAAIGVACHEAGHAMQHSTGYFPLHLRNTMVPVVQVSSGLSWVLIFGGMILQIAGLAWLGVLLFGMVVLYQVVTLPVEFNASRRALAMMTQHGIVTREEEPLARKVLSAAAMTYVAAVITAVMQLLYFMIRLGLIGGSRDE